LRLLTYNFSLSMKGVEVALPAVKRGSTSRNIPSQSIFLLRASPLRGGNRGCKPNSHPARQNLCPNRGCKSGARLIASVNWKLNYRCMEKIKSLSLAMNTIGKEIVGPHLPIKIMHVSYAYMYVHIWPSWRWRVLVSVWWVLVAGTCVFSLPRIQTPAPIGGYPPPAGGYPPMGTSGHPWFLPAL
jgi:hypothetical protein